MRALRLWPLVVGLLLVAAFCSLELRGAGSARAGFTLTCLLDRGLTNGQECSIGETLVLVSKDSGTPTRYTISLAWLKASDLPDFEQDGEYSVELEKLPDGTLVATSIVDVSNRSGASNPGLLGAKTTTTTTKDDQVQAVAAAPVWEAMAAIPSAAPADSMAAALVARASSAVVVAAAAASTAAVAERRPGSLSLLVAAAAGAASSIRASSSWSRPRSWTASTASTAG